MNQSIIFPDLQEWNQQKRVVEFPAQQAGSLIVCSICIEKLATLSGNMNITVENVIEVFLQYRFDIEEIAEEMIEDEMLNALDQVEIR